jgi:hypothetical protein
MPQLQHQGECCDHGYQDEFMFPPSDFHTLEILDKVNTLKKTRSDYVMKQVICGIGTLIQVDSG